jgi:hypothetical protein
MLALAPDLCVLACTKHTVMRSIQAFLRTWVPQHGPGMRGRTPVFTVGLFQAFVLSGVVAAVMVEAAPVRGAASHLQEQTTTASTSTASVTAADVSVPLICVAVVHDGRVLPDPSSPRLFSEEGEGDLRAPVFSALLLPAGNIEGMTLAEFEFIAGQAANQAAVRPAWREDLRDLMDLPLTTVNL